MSHEERAWGPVGRLGRRATGSIIAGVGSLLCALSAYIAWFDGRAPHDLPIRHLAETGAPGLATGYWTSVAAPLAVVGALGALGALIRFRFLLGLAWMVGVATLALWGLMRAIGTATDNAPAGVGAGAGVWVCAAGLLAILVGIVVMGPRKEEVDAPLSMFGDDS
ncbi:hypothetical protein [Jiangella rhizosphaerae]|uniref:Uncharacterized protein n=1 Tax=Jiangella rhizosphaerae TaxID=2293569 RepID=A0A418KV34_9ACTN|nr:hypothetical protein [Jiangella rhizosphaerae]RIQ32156.1 hypothetical protein DY240_06015 [Jiangella rhizosphaerae]